MQEKRRFYPEFSGSLEVGTVGGHCSFELLTHEQSEQRGQYIERTPKSANSPSTEQFIFNEHSYRLDFRGP